MIVETEVSPPPSRGDIRRRRLLDTARALFIEHGFHQTGVAQISTASGVQVGQIYRDFACKDDIIAAIAQADLADWFENPLASLAADGDHAGVREEIRRFVSLEMTVAQGRILTEVLAEAGRSERIAEIVRKFDARARERLAEALAMLAPEPRCADARARLVDMILVLRTGLVAGGTLAPAGDSAAIRRRTREIIDRELDQLQRSAKAKTGPVEPG